MSLSGPPPGELVAGVAAFGPLAPGASLLETHAEQASGLLQAIATLGLDAAPRIVQIVAPSGGEGASEIARGTARLVGRTLDPAVCLVRIAAIGTADGRPVPATGPGTTPAAIPAATHAATHAPGNGAPRPGGPSLLTLAPEGVAGLLSRGLRQSLETLAPQARVFIIDSPAVNRSVEAFLIAQQSDGVVLVLEAERTFEAEAVAARAVLERAGARLLGAVLNRRRYRVPGPVARAFGLGTAPAGAPRGRGWLPALLFLLLGMGIVLAIPALRAPLVAQLILLGVAQDAIPPALLPPPTTSPPGD